MGCDWRDAQGLARSASGAFHFVLLLLLKFGNKVKPVRMTCFVRFGHACRSALRYRVEWHGLRWPDRPAKEAGLELQLNDHL